MVGLNIIAGLMLTMAAIFVYLLPAYIAMRRGHARTAPIYLLNLFLGWTLIGWAAALIIACLKKQ